MEQAGIERWNSKVATGFVWRRMTIWVREGGGGTEVFHHAGLAQWNSGARCGDRAASRMRQVSWWRAGR
jgi:hypothetical protein